jgi:hypothetical protein
VKFILAELHTVPPSPLILWCDNLGVTFLTSTPIFNARTKHIEIDYHFVRERIVAKKLQLQFMPSREQIVDALTKALGIPRFLLLRTKLTVSKSPLTCEGSVKNIFSKPSITDEPNAVKQTSTN